jgi:hypothetical protein
MISCSSKKSPKVAPNQYLKLYKAHLPKHNICNKFQSDVLKAAIQETENAELHDELYFFVRNEKKAFSYLKQFDLTKFTLIENKLEFEAIINACVMQSSPEHKPCDTLFSGYKFFRALIYGMNQYGWSKKTIALAKNTTLSYLDYLAQTESSLMGILFADDLLMRLADRNYVNNSLYAETITFKHEGEKAYKNLRKQIRKLGKKKLSCVDATDFYANERIKVKNLSQSFFTILNKIK